MLTDGFAVVSKVASKFVHEVLPVALASVLGTLVVNHYSGPATPVVVQANPPPGADDFLRTLRDERAVLAAVLKREEENGTSKGDAASIAPAVALVADDPPAPPQRPATAKKAPTRAKADAKLGSDAGKSVTAAPGPDFQVDAAAPAFDAGLAAAALDDAPPAPARAGPLDGMRALVVNAAQWSAQALPSMPFSPRALLGGSRPF